MVKEDQMTQILAGCIADAVERGDTDLLERVRDLAKEGEKDAGGSQIEMDWWARYSLDIRNMDSFDVKLSGYGFPSNLDTFNLNTVRRKGLVIDDITMKDLKLSNLTDALCSLRGSGGKDQQTSAGRRMLSYMLHFPLNDYEDIRKRQDAIKELMGDYSFNSTLMHYLDTMKNNEAGFVSFVFNDVEGYSHAMKLDMLNQAREYLATAKNIGALLKNTESERLQEISDNLEGLLGKGSIRTLYDSVVDDDDVDVMKLCNKAWTQGLSQQAIDQMLNIAQVMRVIKDSKLTAAFQKGHLVMSPREDNEGTSEMRYPLEYLPLDLDSIKEEYFDQPPLFNIHYTMGMIDALCTAGVFGIAVKNAKFPDVYRKSEYECDLVDPMDPLILLSQHRFKPNSYRIDSENRGYVISGPNSGGKTVFGFTLPRLQVMAQAGLPLPMKEGALALADYIATLRPASREELGEGRFLHSLIRGKEIFQRSTPKSVVCIDDFEGTDPQDCYEQSLIMIKALCRIGAGFTMTTQDCRIGKEILDNQETQYTGVSPVQVTYEEKDGNIYFTFDVVPGVGRSIGGACAKGIGMDENSLDEMLTKKGF